MNSYHYVSCHQAEKSELHCEQPFEEQDCQKIQLAFCTETGLTQFNRKSSQSG